METDRIFRADFFTVTASDTTGVNHFRSAVVFRCRRQGNGGTGCDECLEYGTAPDAQAFVGIHGFSVTLLLLNGAGNGAVGTGVDTFSTTDAPVRINEVNPAAFYHCFNNRLFRADFKTDPAACTALSVDAEQNTFFGANGDCFIDGI
jgi:hypothetical protein